MLLPGAKQARRAIERGGGAFEGVSVGLVAASAVVELLGGVAWRWSGCVISREALSSRLVAGQRRLDFGHAAGVVVRPRSGWSVASEALAHVQLGGRVVRQSPCAPPTAGEESTHQSSSALDVALVQRLAIAWKISQRVLQTVLRGSAILHDAVRRQDALGQVVPDRLALMRRAESSQQKTPLRIAGF